MMKDIGAAFIVVKVQEGHGRWRWKNRAQS